MFNVTEAVLLVIPKVLFTVYCNLYCPGVTLVKLGVIIKSPLPLKLLSGKGTPDIFDVDTDSEAIFTQSSKSWDIIFNIFSS